MILHHTGLHTWCKVNHRSGYSAQSCGIYHLSFKKADWQNNYHHCGSYSWLKERSYLCQPHPHPCLGQELEARRGGPRSVREDKRTVPLGPTGSDKPVTLTCFPGRSPPFTVTLLSSGNGIQFVDAVLTWLAHWARTYSVLIIRE